MEGGSECSSCNHVGRVIKQSEFHSMRGHVAEGTVVLCESGEVLTIKSGMSGWDVYKRDGSLAGHAGFDATAVTNIVLRS